MYLSKMKTQGNSKEKGKMLPLLRGMFIFPESLKRYADIISDFSLIDFMTEKNDSKSINPFQKLMAETTKPDMAKETEQDLLRA